VKLELKSGTLSYIDQGNGPAVLLIHAFPLNKNMWAPQIDALSSRFRVIAPDIRGFGESQPPSAWTMHEMADDLHQLLGALGISDVSVVGVSMGGYIGLTFWWKFPDQVRKIVHANSRARADNDTEKAARNDMIAALQQKGSAILPERMLPRLLQPNPDPAVLRTVRSMIEGVDASAAAYAVMAMRDRIDFSSMLHRLHCPVLVVTGENDAIIRAEDAKALAEWITNARFLKIPNSGHLSNLENPEVFNAALLDFLSA
jgi:pimeloyl-ACP methyl ester carboxylesterase